MSRSRDIAEFRDALRAFAAQRDWHPFYSPKNLAIALSVEAAELLEHFQWRETGAMGELSEDKQSQVRDELADVLLYLIMLADKLDVDLSNAAWDKLEKNGRKYPAEIVRGSSKKYSEL